MAVEDQEGGESPSAVERIHDGERLPILQAIKEQAGELYDRDVPQVTCPCGKEVDLDYAFRCLYCEVFFCKRCAREHFGPQEDDDE